MLGTGLITGASDDDPSGIGTYSIAGASLGFATLWTPIITLPLMAVVQFICAKVGMVSGRGLAGSYAIIIPAPCCIPRPSAWSSRTRLTHLQERDRRRLRSCTGRARNRKVPGGRLLRIALGGQRPSVLPRGVVHILLKRQTGTRRRPCAYPCCGRGSDGPRFRRRIRSCVRRETP